MRGFNGRFQAAAVLITVALLAGCGGGNQTGAAATGEPDCTTAGDCGSGERCASGGCLPCEAAETPYDGEDSDCDASTLDSDLDGDGDNWSGAAVAPGADCDDTDSRIHPGAEEACDDRTDNDCDGRVDEGCLDVGPPLVRFTAPLVDSVVAGTITVELEATDDSGIEVVELLAAGHLVARLQEPPYVHELDSRRLRDGPLLLTARAIDLAGSDATAELAVVLDNVAPTIALLRPVGGEARGGTVTFEATASDVAGITQVSFARGGETLGSVRAPPWKLEVDTSEIPDGLHTISAVALDASGARAATEVALLVDNTVPSLAFVRPAAGTFVRDGVDVELAATDPAGIRRIQSEGEESSGGSLSYHLDLRAAPEGPRTIRATARDLAIVGDLPRSGNEAGSALEVIVDRTPPSIGLLYPASGALVSGTIDLLGTASDGSAIASVRLLVDGRLTGAPVLPTPAFALRWDSSGELEGNHLLTVEALDVAGNSSRVGLPVVVDNQPPTVTLLRPRTGEVHGGTMTVEVTTTDPGGVDRLEVLVDGQYVGGVSGAGPSLSTPVSSRALADGARLVEAHVVDRAGHRTVVPVQVVIDNTPPAVSFVTPAAGASLGQLAAVQVVATDAAGLGSVVSEGFSSPTSPLDYLLSLTLDPEGPRTLTARATDRAIVDDAPGGNVGVASVDVVVDGAPPRISIIAPAPSEVVFGTVTVVADASDGGALSQVQFFVDGAPLGAPVLAPGPYARQLDTRLAGDGSHVIRADASDAAGNDASAAVDVTVDNSAPVVGFVTPGIGEHRGGLMTVEATSVDLAGVASVTLRLDGAVIAVVAAPPYRRVVDTAPLTEGLHLLEATAVDSSGLSRTTGQSFAVDNTAPVVMFATPSAGAFSSGLLDVLVGAVDLGGIARIDSEGQSAAGDSLAYRLDLSGAAEGPRTLTATALDRTIVDDGASLPHSASATVTFELDRTPPTVSIDEPASGAIRSGMVPVRASALDNRGVARVRLFVDATLLADVPAPGPFAVNWESGTVADGAHTLRAEAADLAGNVGSHSISLIVDATAPSSCTLSPPAANVPVSGQMTLTASGSDANGVSSIAFVVDGVTVLTGSGSPVTGSWDSSTVADGWHTLLAVCSDPVGSNRPSTTSNFRVDNTAPVVTLAQHDGDGVFRVTSLTATVSDASSIASVAFSVNGGPPKLDTSSPFGASFDFTGLAGVAQLQAVALDAAGNSGVAVANVVVVPRAGFRVAELWSPVGASVDAFAAGDVSGDGVLDLVLAGSSLSLRTGTGTAWNPAVQLPGASSLRGVSLADVDGDGALDILALADQSLKVLLNQGAGTFAAPVSLSLSGSSAYALARGDLDDDGDPDLVVSFTGSPDAQWYRNDGGSFVLAASLGSLGSATDVQLADLEPDGDLDIVLGRSLSPKITVYRNLGAGLFGAGEDTPTAAPPRRMTVGDLDGVGGPEIVAVMSSLDAFCVLTPAGPGSYSVGPSLPTQSSAAGVALGDVDGDGDRDVVVTSSTGDGFELWTNTAGALQRSARYVAGDSGHKPILVDVDADLDLDLLYGTSSGLSISRGRPGGRFDAAPTFDLPDVLPNGLPVIRGPRAIAVGQLRGTATPELAIALDAVGGGSPLPGQLWTLEYAGNDLFTRADVRELRECANACLVNADCASGLTCVGPLGAKTCCAGALAQVTSVAIGDLDGQNLPDLALGTAATSGTSALLLPAMPGGGYGAITVRSATLQRPKHVVIGDVDNDGQGEAVFSCDGAAGTDGALIVEADGASSVLAAGDGAAAVLVGDLDGDGDRDLAVANGVSGNISLYLWRGPGFRPPTLLSTADGLAALGVGFTAGDARLDLLGLSGSGLELLPGLPGGGFGPPTSWSAGGTGTRLAVGDFNGDGLDDALALSSSTVSVLYARPQGGFFARDTLAMPQSPADFGVGDFDGDGRPDVAIVSTGSKQVTLLFNDR